jgi:hypothetical protein
MRSIVGNDARSQMRLPQRHAEPIVQAGAPTLDKMRHFVDISKAPSPIHAGFLGRDRELCTDQKTANKREP